MCAVTGATACATRRTRCRPFAAAKAWGATTVEIDVMLTADGEPIVLHDRTLDRTTDGHGFAADLGLEEIRGLDAGAGFNSRFARTRVPTVAEVIEWAKREEMGLLLEIKEAERSDLAVDRVADLLEAMDAADRVVVISFDHVVLRRAVERHPGIGTKVITDARHADIIGVLRVRREIRIDRARHVPPGRRESAARCRVFQPG
jgi:glycerophosphoryl diester phosphodiesterase